METLTEVCFTIQVALRGQAAERLYQNSAKIGTSQQTQTGAQARHGMVKQLGRPVQSATGLILRKSGNLCYKKNTLVHVISWMSVADAGEQNGPGEQRLGHHYGTAQGLQYLATLHMEFHNAGMETWWGTA